MKQNEQLKKPFFAKFLESQKITRTNNAAGENPQFLDIHVTNPLFDHDHTLKFPSDSDEPVS